MLKYANKNEMAEVALRNHNHFFDKNSMKFFNSRIVTTTNKYGFFITSEKFDDKSNRFYTIRFISKNGNINTVGRFQAYNTSAQAKKEILKMSNKFDELKKCFLENEILSNITNIYESSVYPDCLEIFNNDKKMIFSLIDFEVKGY